MWLAGCGPGTIGELPSVTHSAGVTDLPVDLRPTSGPGSACRVAWSVVPLADGRAAAPTFTVERGIYTEPFVLEILGDAPGATLVYTTDGSSPSEANGERAASPLRLPVTTTTVVRALALDPDLAPSPVVTHTYVFPADVLAQRASQPGYPHPTLDVGKGGLVELDYEMDPDVVDAPAQRETMVAALQALPTLVISAAPEDLFGGDGIYVNGGSGENSEWEIAASLELLDPTDAGKSGQIDCGLRPHTHRVLKRSFKLLFKSEYGPGKLRSCLMRDAPLHGASAVTKHDRLILRGGTNRAWWSYWNPDDSTYTRDQWARDTQIAMSGVGAHGTFVHLYLNGLYFGVYNAAERPDAWFTSEYLGGEKEEWFAVNHGGVVSGDPTRWSYLTTTLVNHDMSDPSSYAELGEYVDLEQFADYLLLNWYAGTDDWPGNNWYAGGRVSPPGPFRFFVWDAEDIWDSEASSGPEDQPGGRGHDGAWVHPAFRAGATNSAPIAKLWRAARQSADFLALLAARVDHHCAPGGALSTDEAQRRWRVLGEHLRPALAGEAARWGDAREPLGEPLRVVESAFDPEFARVLEESMPGNCERLVEALRAEGLYPTD